MRSLPRENEILGGTWCNTLKCVSFGGCCSMINFFPGWIFPNPAGTEQLLLVHPVEDQNPWIKVFKNRKEKGNGNTWLRPRQGEDLEPQELSSGNKRMSWRQVRVGKEMRRILGMETDWECRDEWSDWWEFLCWWNVIEGFSQKFYPAPWRKSPLQAAPWLEMGSGRGAAGAINSSL